MISYFIALYIASQRAPIQPIAQMANEARVEYGCGELVERKQLDRSAIDRAYYLSSTGEWSHDGWTKTVRKYWRNGRIGENLAKDFSKDEAAFSALMESPTHRDNILDCDYKYIGIGKSGEVTVMHFAE